MAWEPQGGGGASQQGGGGLTPRVGPVGAPAGSSFPWMAVGLGPGKRTPAPPSVPRPPGHNQRESPRAASGAPRPLARQRISGAIWWDPQGGEQREVGWHPGSQCSRSLAWRQICTPVDARTGCTRVLRGDRTAGNLPGPPASAPIVASRCGHPAGRARWALSL